uniref:Structural protein n=1 Tax=Melipona quadrifasciata densovirus TaxID=2571172 RepID=A0A4D6NSQ3_9VIRU|nr:structural protein [Melipona quadrifasciata densovirus]
MIKSAWQGFPDELPDDELPSHIREMVRPVKTRTGPPQTSTPKSGGAANTRAQTTNRNTGPAETTIRRKQPGRAPKRTEKQQQQAREDSEYDKRLREWEESNYEEGSHDTTSDSSAVTPPTPGPSVASRSHPDAVFTPSESSGTASSESTSTGQFSGSVGHNTGGSAHSSRGETSHSSGHSSSHSRSSFYNSSGHGMSQPGSSRSGGPGSSVGGAVIVKDHAPSPHGQLSFSHTFQVQTPTVQYKSFNFGEADQPFGIATNTGLLSTPLCTLDPDNLAIYMTQAEYYSIPPHSWAAHCHIKVTPLGYRAPFVTNETIAQFANSQTIVQCVSGVGLNKVMNGVLAPYTFDATDPTNVTGIDVAKNLPTAEAYSERAIATEPIWWNCFWTPLCYKDENNKQHWPMLAKYYDVQNVNDCKGTPVINYEYNFKVSPLKWDTNFDQFQSINQPIPEGNNNISYSWRNVSNPNDNKKRGATAYTATGQTMGVELKDDPNFDYNTCIEKSFFMTVNCGNSVTPDAPPLLHFGTMPLSTSTQMNEYKYAPLICIWEIETNLTVHYSMDYLLNDRYLLIPQAWDPIYDRYILKHGDKYIKTNTCKLYAQGRRVPCDYNATSYPCYNDETKKNLTTVNLVDGTKFPKSSSLPVLTEEESPHKRSKK